jgi:Flp pilus assembly protein TadB
MASDNGKQANPTDGLADVLTSITQDAEKKEEEPSVLALRDRVDAVEQMFDELSRARQLQDALSLYITDLRDEVADLRQYRFFITGFSWLMSIVAFFLVYCLVSGGPAWFTRLNGTLQVPLVVSLLVSAVILQIVLLKAVYRSRQERNHGDMLPEVVRVALETFNGLK